MVISHQEFSMHCQPLSKILLSEGKLGELQNNIPRHELLNHKKHLLQNYKKILTGIAAIHISYSCKNNTKIFLSE